jgi:hypothetical protein
LALKPEATGNSGRFPPGHVAAGDEKGAPLHVCQSKTDENHKAVAHDLDDVDRSSDRRRRRTEKDRYDRHDGDGNGGLNARRREREDDAATPSLAIGDDIGRNHGLAVTGTYGVKDAVQEGDGEQAARGRAILLAGPNVARQRAIEFRLFHENPPRQARGRHARRGMPGTERSTLRPCSIDGADRRDRGKHQQQRNA